MTFRAPNVVVFAGLAVASLLLTGCPQPAAEDSKPADAHAGHSHGHDAPPTTLAAAHAAIAEHGQAIRTAFEANSPDDAHHALHDIGSVITSLPKLAQAAGLEAADEVQQVTDQLMDAYGKLDGGLHGGAMVAWSDVSQEIEAAMTKLKSWLPADEAEADHDHADHDHAGDDHADHDHAGHDHDHADHEE